MKFNLWTLVGADHLPRPSKRKLGIVAFLYFKAIQERNRAMVEAFQEKRCSPRKHPKSPIGAWFLLPENTERYESIISNVSSGGLGIVSGISVDPGTLIKIFPGHLDKGILGEIRWCTPDSWGLNVYGLGVKAVKAVKCMGTE